MCLRPSVAEDGNEARWDIEVGWVSGDPAYALSGFRAKRCVVECDRTIIVVSGTAHQLNSGWDCRLCGAATYSTSLTALPLARYPTAVSLSGTAQVLEKKQ
jgi:hypothetical protein